MLNIFNLFLFLLALWILFMISAGHLSWLYVFFGILASGLVSIASSRLGVIEKRSELLYLSFGFYRHFFKIFASNFFSSIKLIANIALTKQSFQPLVYKIKMDSEKSFNPLLLALTFSMTSGLFCIGLTNDEILVHAIDEKYFEQFDLKKTCAILAEVNDDNLV